MNEYIFEQLKKCKVAVLPKYDINSTEIVVHKLGTKSGESISVGKYYIIKLDDYLLSKETSLILHQNWNNNIFPKSNSYKCECLKVMGGMIKIAGSGYNIDLSYDTDDYWVGWLPIKGIDIIKEI